MDDVYKQISVLNGKGESKGSSVYVRDDEIGWREAELISVDPKTQTGYVLFFPPDAGYRPDPQILWDMGMGMNEAVAVDLTEYKDGELPLRNDVIGSNNDNIDLTTQEDLCDLEFLHEAGILYNLRDRYELEMQIYTRVGTSSSLIVGINPYTSIDSLYTEEQRQMYAQRIVYQDGSAVGNLPPHIYEISAHAYRGMLIDGMNQSILVSGESGAGKTETVKILMTHLADVRGDYHLMDGTGHISHEKNNKNDRNRLNNIPSSEDIVVMVLDTNPILEAFGNAKTTKNDNSSRFSKYVQLQYESYFLDRAVPKCKLAGSFCNTYLLEKARVVNHEFGERSFHIFYQLLSAPNEFREYIWGHLSTADGTNFKYIGKTKFDTIDGISDEERWFETIAALQDIGLDGDMFRHLFRILCSVLQFGNIVFEEDRNEAGGCVISSSDQLDLLSDVLDIPAQALIKALTSSEVKIQGENFTKPISPATAREGADALAKQIYANLFDWLVRYINNVTSAADENLFIGLLDIFGFEALEVNRFEQLLINHANERLQKKFTEDIFESIKYEYQQEEIPIPKFESSDNEEVLEIIEGQLGMINFLVEECTIPGGSDAGFVTKVCRNFNNKGSSLYRKPNFTRNQFAIKHFAGTLLYDSSKFVAKNSDTLPDNLLQCVNQSENIIIQECFQGVRTKSIRLRTRKSLISDTEWSKFRSQLNELMNMLGETQTRYVRCIKPNTKQTPMSLDLKHAALQLKSTGLTDTVAFLRSLYPNRMGFNKFLDRFRALTIRSSKWRFMTSQAGGVLRGDIKILLDDLLWNFEAKDSLKCCDDILFACGKSKVFFRPGVLEFLENERLLVFDHCVTMIQSRVRCNTSLVKFKHMKKRTIIIQSFVRRIFAYKRVNRMKQQLHASILIQSYMRRFLGIRLFERRKLEIKLFSSATVIQRFVRSTLHQIHERRLKQQHLEKSNVSILSAESVSDIIDCETKHEALVYEERNFDHQEKERNLRIVHFNYLRRISIDRSATEIQCMIRKFSARKRFQYLIQHHQSVLEYHAILIQSFFRVVIGKKKAQMRREQLSHQNTKAKLRDVANLKDSKRRDMRIGSKKKSNGMSFRLMIKKTFSR